jgi:hypothetical protein
VKVWALPSVLSVLVSVLQMEQAKAMQSVTLRVQQTVLQSEQAKAMQSVRLLEQE